MPLLASTCARCGAAVPNPDGPDVPMCGRCQELLRQRLQPDAESPRRCPVDGAVMEKRIAHQVVVDRCPTCGGVWLDGGEIEVLRRAVQGGGRDPLARNVVLGLG